MSKEGTKKRTAEPKNIEPQNVEGRNSIDFIKRKRKMTEEIED